MIAIHSFHLLAAEQTEDLAAPDRKIDSTESLHRAGWSERMPQRFPKRLSFSEGPFQSHRFDGPGAHGGGLYQSHVRIECPHVDDRP